MQQPIPARLCLLGISLLFCMGGAWAQEFSLALSTPDAPGQWVLSETNAHIDNGELILDGREDDATAFFAPFEWADVTLRAQFMVEPADKGVLACGFIVRAQDAATRYYVHFDRAQAILCRSDKTNEWIEIKRVGGLDKPAGQWHTGELQCTGNTLRVSLNGVLLYETSDNALASGRIGFYAGQGLVHVKDIVVTGEKKPAAAPITIPRPMFSYVCKDAGAGAYEAFPDVCRLSDGRLMCVFYAGYGHIALPNAQLPNGGRVSYCLSSDEGRTWTPAATLYDGPDDDRDPSITQLKNGRLICNFFSLRSAPGKSPAYDGLGTWMVYSDDLGATWSAPQQISKDYYCSSPIRQLSNGNLILGLYAEKDGKGWGAVTISEDNSGTWSPVIDIDNGGMPLDAETDVIELPDGSVYAAERGRGDTMAWSLSKDGGRSWSVSQPFGFPGHCPYLLRTLDGILLMAHRMPNTSLHFSLDDGKTWSENVLVDDHIGAYPSMVSLKDGTTLIVYYEEGEGSSIRARRFLATHTGITWMPVDEGVVPAATLVDYRRIWNDAPHNAFTNLTRFQDRWFCVFREGEKHVSPDGALRVITSPDGNRWESAAHLTSPIADLRDAQICITPDQRLMLSGAAALHPPAAAKHQTMAYFSSDGKAWTEGVPIGEPNLWLWRVTWHKNTAYGIGYATDGPDKFVRLYKSSDGVKFETLVDHLAADGYPNESGLVFLPDDSCLGLLRRDGDGPKNTGLLGRALPPYTEWTWMDLGVRIGGPCMTQLPDGRLVATVRLYDGRTRTALCSVDPAAGTLRELLTLPSGGDTSYAGMVWYDNLLWISYYSSHEKQTCIYLAKVRL